MENLVRFCVRQNGIEASHLCPISAIKCAASAGSATYAAPCPLPCVSPPPTACLARCAAAWKIYAKVHSLIRLIGRPKGAYYCCQTALAPRCPLSLCCTPPAPPVNCKCLRNLSILCSARARSHR